MKASLALIGLFLIVSGVKVSLSDKCSRCNDLLYDQDCIRKGPGCIWTPEGKCIEGEQKHISYCSSQSNSKCSQTIGCAYLQQKCIHFAGCSAYIGTTTEECQAISKLCISNGKYCMNAKKCSEYGSNLCGNIIDQFYQRCKWDIETKSCRNYQCTEADSTYTTDKRCKELLTECVTTGAGCVSQPLPNCNRLKGTESTCLQMTGSDGKCKFGQGTSCDLLLCSDYKNTVNIKVTDEDCQQIQTFCLKSTGKGCTTVLDVCSSYQVLNEASIDCKGYLGLDGRCEGNYGATRCRARICEDGKYTTDEACNEFKEGCVTNGIQCFDQRQLCSQYDGTIAACQFYIGIDGRCKLDINTQTCTPRDCEVDSQKSYTDEQCQTNIQSYCLSTGQGCVKRLESCSSYSGVECTNLIGSEGYCKGGKEGNCTAIQCQEASKNIITNGGCSSFQKGCVTNGAGCIPQTTCAQTEKQISCLGSQENNVYCIWNEFCVTSLSCNQFSSKFICLKYKVSGLPCYWDGACRNAVCTDYSGSNYQSDSACAILPGCIFNGTQCVLPSPCSNLKGTKLSCLQYKAYCTNTDSATVSDQCIERSCTDDLKLTTDSNCKQYLPDCVTNGNGCISNKAPCSSYIGNNIECNRFYGFSKLDNIRKQCWNTSQTNGPCVEKTCSHATQIISFQQCQEFLEGCVYDGKNGCIPSSSDCSQFAGSSTADCAAFKGNNGSKNCWWTSGFTCTTKLCFYDTISTNDIDCKNFLPGCVTKGKGCIEQTAPCQDYVGTLQECNLFAQTLAFGIQIKCTKLEYCVSKVCSDKIDAKGYADCVNYHQNCRLEFQSNNCIYEQDQCTAYNLKEDSYSFAKLSYCNNIILSDNKTYCGYNPSILGTCSARQCSFWLSTLGVSCVDYLGKNTCRLSNNGNCYSPGQCSLYTIPEGTIDQIIWCSNMLDNSPTPQKCTFNNNISQINCSSITRCEDIQSPTNAAQCNQIIGSKYCQYVQGKCYTTKLECTEYILPLTKNLFEFCKGLKVNNFGVVTLCKYDPLKSTQNCIGFSCSDVSQPISQENCDQAIRGCKYFNGFCYSITTCNIYEIPISIIDNSQKRQFCQNMQNIGTKEYCSYIENQSTCNIPKYCNQFFGQTIAECIIFRDKSGTVCTWKTGTQCDIATGDQVCLAVPGNVINIQYCDLRTTVGVCQTKSSQCYLKETNCTLYNYGFADNLNSKVAICQMFSDINGNYCTYYESNTTCMTSKNTCNDWNVLSISDDNITFCKVRIDKTGKQCTYDLGSAACRTFYACENAFNPQSQSDCDFISTGCVYSNQKCFILSYCQNYYPVGQNEQEKMLYCSQLFDKSQNRCTYIQNMISCFPLGECFNYTVDHLSDPKEKIQVCLSLISKKNEKCTYWTGSTCQVISTCNSYKNGQFENICQLQQDKNGKTCLQQKNDVLSCESPSNCEYLQNISQQQDCDKYIYGCIYFQGKCYTLNQCSLYFTDGKGAINFCKQIKDTRGNYCTAISDQDYNCSTRLCSDVNYPTHIQCKSYLSSCKSDGTKCIDASISCSQQKGLSSFCEWALDTDGISTCATPIPSLISESCMSRMCSQNIKSTTDADCEAYQSGCLTNGHGCISNTEPCSKYYGTISNCKQYTGNFIKCWGKSDSIQDFCRDRVCTDLNSTSDKDCAAFIPSINEIPNCVSNGVRCVSYPIKCSEFIGSKITCPQFQAIDGPCKETTKDSTPQPCTPRVCEEANKNLITLEECQKYHPNCVTDGKKCKHKSISCEEVQTYFSCQGKIGCQWISQCQTAPNNCSDLSSPSLCVNTILSDKLTYCTWSNNICRNFTCEDYNDSSYKTHELCQSKDKTCTTNGEGCITIGVCSSYLSEIVCNNATTTEESKRCKWEQSSCRQTQCTDYDGNTDEECQNLQPELNCKTNGERCFGSIYDCSTFNGNQSMCLMDSDGNPCLYVKEKCYKYTSCNDAKGKTLAECQEFNSLCVPTETDYCAAQTQCEWYTTKKTCKVGTNSTLCGWLPTGKCQDFTECSDLISTSHKECNDYESQCTTDGTKCIFITLCSSYTTKASCIQEYNGTPCRYAYPVGQNTGTLSCRAMECVDLYGTQNQQCIIEGKSCVTDGTKCVNKNKCEYYHNKISCDSGGLDGDCIFIETPTNTEEGTCEVFKSCYQANNDKEASKKKPQSCIWTKTGQNKESCQDMVCSMKGSSCSPIPSIDGSQYTICDGYGSVCYETEPNYFSSKDCNILSAFTYTWNKQLLICQKCKQGGSSQPTPVNATNGTTPNDTTTTSALDFYVPCFVLGFFM